MFQRAPSNAGMTPHAFECRNQMRAPTAKKLGHLTERAPKLLGGAWLLKIVGLAPGTLGPNLSGSATSAGARPPKSQMKSGQRSPGADVAVSKIRRLLRRELILFLQLREPVLGISRQRPGISRLQVDAIEAG